MKKFNPIVKGSFEVSVKYNTSSKT